MVAASRQLRQRRAAPARKSIIGLALALLTIPLSTSIASAACNPPKVASTYHVATGEFTYWTTTIPASNGLLVGKFWSGATDNTGTCSNSGSQNFLYFGASPGDVGLSLNLGMACVVGCPSNSLSFDARAIDSTRTQEQMLMVKAPETPNGGVSFDFSHPSYAMCNAPRPVIDDLQSSGTTRTAHFSIGFVTSCGNAISDITGWNILSAASATDPGIFGSYGLRASFAVVPGSNASASGSVSLDCSNASLDQWATGQVVTNGAVNHLVGPTTRVSCKTGSVQCSGVPDGTVCDDGNPSTFHDTCHVGNCIPGCVGGPNACTDGDACTANDTCTNGVCAGTPIVCNDANLCTTDTCNPATGCVFTNNTAPCNDANACTTTDTCGGGSCQPGPPPNCNDGNPCTTDSCAPASGCGHTTLADGTACTFGTTCSLQDTCRAGVCLAPATVSSPAGSPVGVGANPSSAASGDFNRDGLLDLAVANQSSNDATILLGNGAGGFTQASGSPIGVGSSPHSVAAADLDRDGALDLVVANVLGNDVSILRGDGSGQFSPAPGSPVGVGTQPVSVAIGDFNGNGRLDLAVANFGSNDITILDQGPAGTFGPVVSPIPVGTQPAFVTVLDVNGDGTLDLVVVNSGSNDVAILLGDGSAGFTPAPGSPVAAGGTLPNSVALADLNGDGTLDLALANSLSDSATILLGDGTGRFSQAGAAIGVGAKPLSIVAGDLNGDGVADLAVANNSSNDATLLLGLGSGGFAPAAGSPMATGARPDFAAFGDMNGDGKLDLAVVNRISNDVAILMNDTIVAPNDQACDDGSSCTANDACFNGGCAGASSSCASQCVMPPSGLTGWWPGEGLAADISGSFNHGSLMNGATFEEGIVGQAFNLDGVNDYVNVPFQPNLVPGAGSFSVGAWIKPRYSGGQWFIVAMNECGASCPAGARSLYELRTNTVGAWFQLRDSTATIPRTATSGAQIYDGAWHLLVGTRDLAANTLNLYVDDNGSPGTISIGPNADGPIQDPENRPVTIGAELDDGASTLHGFFPGLIDEVMYANGAFTPSEVQALYAAGNPRLCRCADTDGDGYGAVGGVSCPNGTQQDCNDSPGHGGVWSAPIEVRNLKLSSADTTTLTWDAQAAVVGPDVTYDVIRGDLSSLMAGYSGACVGSGITVATMADAAVPSVGAGYWYLVRGHDTCGVGSYGNQGIHGVTGAERVSAIACP